MPVLTKERTATRRESGSNLLSTMQAAAIDRFGGPELLSLHTLPVPAVDEGEVLIRLEWAGVGSWDAEMRAGWWPAGRPRFPLVLGTDGSGVVVAVGARVRRLHVGDAVYAYSFANSKGGFYAEYVAVAAHHAGLVPATLRMREAGAIPTTGLTALQGIDNALRIRHGESLLIHGAGGGVGTLAVQFAKLRGAYVVATASGADGMALVRRLGADAAVDGKSADLKAAALAFVPEGFDAVLGLAGGEGLQQCCEAIRRGGRFAYPNGVEPVPRKRRDVETIAYDAVAGAREFIRLSRAVDAAKLRVPIAGSYALADAVRAHERLEQGHVLGKIVMRVR